MRMLILLLVLSAGLWFGLRVAFPGPFTPGQTKDMLWKEVQHWSRYVRETMEKTPWIDTEEWAKIVFHAQKLAEGWKNGKWSQEDADRVSDLVAAWKQAIVDSISHEEVREWQKKKGLEKQ